MTKVKVYENKRCCVYKEDEDVNEYLRVLIPGKISSRVVETIEPENIEQIKIVREANNLDESLELTEPVPKFKELPPEFFSSKEKAIKYASQFSDLVWWTDDCKFHMNLPDIFYVERFRDYINICKIIVYGSSSDAPLTPDTTRIHNLNEDCELVRLAEKNEKEWKKRTEPLKKKQLDEVLRKLKKLGII